MVKVWALKGLLLLSLEMERQSRMINWCPTPLSFLFLSESLSICCCRCCCCFLPLFLFVVVGKQHGRETVEEDRQVGRVESQTRAEPDSGLSTHPKVHPVLSHLRHNPVPGLSGATVNCAESSEPTCLVHQPREPVLQIFETSQHLRPDSGDSIQKLISLYGGKHRFK